MFWARGIVLYKNLTTLRCPASYSYLSSINHFYIENNPGISGFGVWPEQNFPSVFNENQEE